MAEDLVITLVVGLITAARPTLGLVLALNSFVLRGALQPDVAANELSGFSGAGIPFIVLTVVLLREIRTLPRMGFGIADLVVLGFVATLLGGATHAPDLDAGTEIAARFAFLAASFYFAARLYFCTRVYSRLSRLVQDFFVVAVALSIPAWGTFDWASGQRLSIGTITPIPFSYLIAIGVVAGAHLALSSSRNRVKMLYLLGSAYLVWILVGTNTKGTTLACLGALLTYFVVSYQYQGLSRAKLRFGVVAAAITAAVVVRFGTQGADGGLVHRFKVFSTDQSTTDRLLAWHDAWNAFQQNPWFGVGTGGFLRHSFLGYVHNLPLELLVEQGVIGATLFVLLVLVSGHSIRRFSRSRNPTTMNLGPVVSALLVLTLIEAQFSFTLWMHKLLLFAFGVAAALAMADARASRSARELQTPVATPTRMEIELVGRAMSPGGAGAHESSLATPARATRNRRDAEGAGRLSEGDCGKPNALRQ